MNLVLGTANFGNKYGIANKQIDTRKIDYFELLNVYVNLGYSLIDTAPNYGFSEKILGESISQGNNLQCYTKLPLQACENSTTAILSIVNSTRTLNVSTVKGIYFHDIDYLIEENPRKVISIIDAIEDCGMVEKLGASCYTIRDIEIVANRFPKIKLFQVPASVLDQRLKNQELMTTLEKNGIEFHVRSIFLQGILLMAKAPHNLQVFQPAMDSLHRMANENNCSLVDLCVSYIRSFGWASSIVVGVNSIDQLLEIHNSRYLDIDFNVLYDSNLDYFLDPRNWKNE